MARMKTASQTLLLLVAGAGAFYAAADWSRQGAFDATSAAPEVVAATARPPADGAASAAASTTASAAAASAADASASASSRRVPSAGGTAFAPLSWLPEPPPPPPAAAPAPPPPAPRPVAPPLPFVFVGMVERGADRPQAYLAKGEVLLVVSVGDFIENHTYRVDALAATGVVLTYLPLDKQQTVNVPGGTP
jgi:hypothetical protein